MTPRRQRQALCVFLLLAVAVAYNALFRQLRPALGGLTAEVPAAPAPVRTTPSKAAPSPPAERTASLKDAPEKRGVRVVRAKPEWANTEATGASVVAQKSDAASLETVRAIQRELRQRGYGNLPSDGTLRPQTRAAIMAYEYDHGLPLTAQANEGLLSRILFGGSSPGEGLGKVGAPEAAELVRFVQQSLAALGYQPGPVNGQLEADTMRAIREFEVDKGLVPKGRISAELLGQLTGPTAPKLSRR